MYGHGETRFGIAPWLCAVAYVWTVWTAPSRRDQNHLALAGSVVSLTCTRGGDDGSRTHDLFIANEALCQLSYVPGTTRRLIIAAAGDGQTEGYSPEARV